MRGEFRVFGVLCAIAGLLLLAENFGWLAGFHKLWPVLPAFVGSGLILLFRQRGGIDLLLLGIGTFLAGVSILFLVLNFTASWGSLDRAWPVFIGLVGVSSCVTSVFGRRSRKILAASGMLLIFLAVVFYLVFGVDTRLWPVSLTVVGLWILFVPWARARHARTVAEERIHVEP